MAEIEPFLGKKIGKIWIPQKTPFLENRSQRPNPLTQNRTLWGFYMFKGWGQVGGSGRSGSQNHRFMITKFLSVGPLKVNMKILFVYFSFGIPSPLFFRSKSIQTIQFMATFACKFYTG